MKEKNIWGSSRYKILFLPESYDFNRLSGVLVFYDLRHEMDRVTCGSTRCVIDTVVKFWEKSQQAVLKRKVANWIAEYLNELGIKCTAEQVMRYLEGEKEEKAVDLDLHEAKIQKIDAETIVEQFLSETESDIKIKVDGVEYDFETPLTAEAEKVLEKMLKETLPEPVRRIKSSGKYKTPDGKEKEFELESLVESTGAPAKKSVVTSFENEEDFSIIDLILETPIPKEFDVTNTKINLENVEHEFIETNIGAIFKCKVPEIKPNESLVIQHELNKRVIRNVVAMVGPEILNIKLYFPIKKIENGFEALIEITNNRDQPMTMTAMDIIPKEFDIKGVVPSMGYLVDTTEWGDIQVKWDVQTVNPKAKNLSRYLLDLLDYDIRLIGKINDESGNEILKIMKFVEPNFKENMFKIVIGLKPKNDLSNIVLMENIGDGVIKNIIPQDLDMETKTSNDGESSLKIKIPELKARETYFFGYIRVGGTSFSAQMPDVIVNGKTLEIITGEEKFQQESLVEPPLISQLKTE